MSILKYTCNVAIADQTEQMFHVKPRTELKLLSFRFFTLYVFPALLGEFNNQETLSFLV